MKNIPLFILACCANFIAHSQSITAQLIDKGNGNPIPYATIKTNEHQGVISNEEGFFTIHIDESVKTLSISCLGYKHKTIETKDLKNTNTIITLEEALNQLDEVFISNKTPNARSIIAKARENLSKNYTSKLNKYNVFSRMTNYIDFKVLEFEIEKASHVNNKNIEAANTDLVAMSKKVRESNMVQFEDFKGELYSLNRDSSKIKVSKATKLLDHTNDFSLDDIQEKSQKIVLKYLDSSKTYKIKSGLFKLEDSLDLNDEKLKNLQKKEYQLNALNTNTRRGLRGAQFYQDAFLNKFLDEDLYQYRIESTTFDNDELTYVIRFIPRKSKAKYTGSLSINHGDFAITKVDYHYSEGKQGKKINLKFLLGVKYIHTISSGTILYNKSSDSLYHPKYIKHNYGNYFYASRDVKFIENSRDKNKVSFSFTVEGSSRFKQELLITGHEALSEVAFNAVKQDTAVAYKELKKFDKSIWGKDQILEPSTEIKNFQSE
ncbi:DUF5686 and carboxypeptidase regulatory-like domain-containing protein [Tamlana agarivorans]|uniref:DUF5686 and carboxypeptidase regulatory-like domain-containing protein n=1 Tax=Pseudotamlana agarivorans TaxID=481183 RepID=A0ACC5UCK3_9FLAO|nr:carboxypeptidase-like regulatory domain-containing protein [Tamlana agarivorans]MBU2952072.1 DUF5686 and carboxypeptidase regulatory-like domain-containing protein [Tamlana agarivorans]